MLSAATLFALSSSASCCVLQIPFADACVNQLLALAFGDTNGCEDVLWQGDVSGDLNEIHITRAHVLTVCHHRFSLHSRR